MKTTQPNHRRSFLLAAGLGGAGAVAAVVASRSGKPQGAANDLPAVDEPTGYRVSAHILKYYKTTEV